MKVFTKTDIGQARNMNQWQSIPFNNLVNSFASPKLSLLSLASAYSKEILLFVIFIYSLHAVINSSIGYILFTGIISLRLLLLLLCNDTDNVH